MSSSKPEHAASRAAADGIGALTLTTFAQVPWLAVTDRVIAAAAHQIGRGALARLAGQHHREDTDR
jgi:hypothetical protein